MNALQRFLSCLAELIRLRDLYFGGILVRERCKDLMIPWAMKLVTIVWEELTYEDCKEAMRQHPDAERVLVMVGSKP